MQKNNNAISDFIKLPSSPECTRKALLDEPDMLTSTYYLQNGYDITLNQIKTNEKLQEGVVDIATSCIREDDMPLFTFSQVVCKNSSSGLSEDLEQSSIMKLSDDKLQQINNLIKNFQDLSVFIEQALLS